MTLHEMIKAHASGKGEDAMWQAVCAVSKYVDAHKDEDPESYSELEKNLFSIMEGKHFDEDFGRAQIDEMWYVDSKGIKHIAPYWTDDELEEVWQNVRSAVPSTYTKWDFFVTLNMMKADYCNLLKEWWPDADEETLTSKVTDLAIAWLNDPDSHHKDCKVWCYFNC